MDPVREVLIGEFLGTLRLSVVTVRRFVEANWQISHLPGITYREDRNSWAFNFHSHRQASEVLLNGPFVIEGMLLWFGRPTWYNPVPSVDFTCVPTWVELHGVPLYMMKAADIEYIASSVGPVLRTDMHPTNECLTTNPRALVYVNYRRPLITSVGAAPRGHPDNSIEVFFSYKQGLPCCRCGMFFHTTALCRESDATVMTRLNNMLSLLDRGRASATVITDVPHDLYTSAIRGSGLLTSWIPYSDDPALNTPSQGGRISDLYYNVPNGHAPSLVEVSNLAQSTMMSQFVARRLTGHPAVLTPPSPRPSPASVQDFAEDSAVSRTVLLSHNDPAISQTGPNLDEHGSSSMATETQTDALEQNAFPSDPTSVVYFHPGRTYRSHEAQNSHEQPTGQNYAPSHPSIPSSTSLSLPGVSSRPSLVQNCQLCRYGHSSLYPHQPAALLSNSPYQNSTTNPVAAPVRRPTSCSMVPQLDGSSVPFLQAHWVPVLLYPRVEHHHYYPRVVPASDHQHWHQPNSYGGGSIGRQTNSIRDPFPGIVDEETMAEQLVLFDQFNIQDQSMATCHQHQQSEAVQSCMFPDKVEHRAGKEPAIWGCESSMPVSRPLRLRDEPFPCATRVRRREEVAEGDVSHRIVRQRLEHSEVAVPLSPIPEIDLNEGPSEDYLI